MTIVRSGDKLFLGNDLADCMTRAAQSHGKVTIRGSQETTLEWQSTTLCGPSEQAIREAVRSEYKQVSYFESQAI